jgi:hypothetical protein
MNVAWTLYLIRDFDGAAAHVRRAAELDPRTAHRARQVLALIHAVADSGPLSKENEEMLDAALKSCLGQGSEPHEGLFSEPVWRRGMRTYCDPVYLATLHTILGDLEEAILWLEDGILDRSSWLSDIAVDPIFEPLHRDPRFQALIDGINL